MVTVDLLGLHQDDCSGIGICEKNLSRELTKKKDVHYYWSREYLKDPYWKRYSQFFKKWMGYDTIKKKDNSKLIHIMDQNSAWILAFFTPKHPVIVTIYDLFMYDTSDDLKLSFLEKTKYKHLFDLIRNVEGITTISQYTKQQIVNKLGYPEEKIAVIYEAVDNKQFHPLKKKNYASLLEKYAIPKGKRIILNVGTEIPRKNVSFLLDIFSLLQKEQKDIVLVKIGKPFGDEYRKAHIKKRAALGLDASCFFIDYVTTEELAEFYNCASVVVSPSLREGGFALPLLEAMACGAPVVCSDIPPLRETVAEAGFFASPHNASDFAKKIEIVLENKEKVRELQRKGQQRAKLFTWEAAAAQLFDIYEETAKRSP